MDDIEKQIKKQNSLNNLKRFGRDKPVPIPSPESKKKGWERKRQAQEMMDKVREYMQMPQSEFLSLLEDIKSNPEKYTVQDALLAKYATKAFNGEKFMLDWFDRNVSKAPQNISGDDGGPIKILIERVTTEDENSETSI